MTYLLILLAGAALYLVGAIWVIAVAFMKSFWWGLGCLCFPPLTFLFVLYCHTKMRYPLALKLCGVALIIGGLYGLKLRGILN